VVHSLSEEHKKKLLFFATGSDRVPIKGLGNLPFVISRNGPHCDRLPTAHTCFNHLLLPGASTIHYFAAY
jgi:ubiquitin-protein ligase E3 A